MAMTILSLLPYLIAYFNVFYAISSMFLDDFIIYLISSSSTTSQIPSEATTRYNILSISFFIVYGVQITPKLRNEWSAKARLTAKIPFTR